MSKRATVQAVLDAFGIEDGSITAVDISLRVDEYPKITVTRVLKVAVEPLSQEYVLVDKDKAPKAWPE